MIAMPHNKLNDPLIEIQKILKREARSFYLSLSIFPGDIRKKIFLAFLLCKIADTLVDSGLFNGDEKKKILLDFAFVLGSIEEIDPFLEKVASRGGFEKEKELLFALKPTLTLLSGCSQEERVAVLEQVRHVSIGMQMDLFVFDRPVNASGFPVAYGKELDEYCFQVAGSAGAFMTRIFIDAGYFSHTPDIMVPLGIDLGKGLQLVNILRDRIEDSRRGRFYLEEGATLSDLTPVIRQALFFLEEGLKYVTYIPRRSWRIRLASLWPVLFGLKTIQRFLERHSGDEKNKVKLSRGEVYRTILLSLLIVWSNGAVTRYAHGIRNRVLKNPVLR